MKKLIDLIKNNITLLVQISVFIFTILAAFVFPPQMDNFSEDDTVFSGLAKFILAVAVGMMYIPILKYSQKKYALRWLSVSVILLIGGLLVFYYYFSARDDKRAKYFDKLFVIGDDEDLTKEAWDLKKEKEPPELSPQDLMKYFAISSPDQLSYIWKKEGIRANRLHLIYTYILTILLFSLCLLAVIQAIQCQLKKNRTPRAHKAEPVP